MRSSYHCFCSLTSFKARVKASILNYEKKSGKLELKNEL